MPSLMYDERFCANGCRNLSIYLENPVVMLFMAAIIGLPGRFGFYEFSGCDKNRKSDRIPYGKSKLLFYLEYRWTALP